MNFGNVVANSISDFVSNNLVIVAFSLLLLFLIFLLMREFLTWYWKINKIVNLLEDIKNNTSPEVPKEPPPHVQIL